ncbi:periplasmic protein TonB [Opitutaceae bacterium TAV1]|nr:periplasmic protein TonB [Opitutaceae bacterium TAV1]
MKRDLLAGVLVATLLITGLAFSNRLLPSGPETAAPAEADMPVIALVPLPQLEPEPPSPEEFASLSDNAPAPDISDLAPPMQADTPAAAVSTTAFVQKLQPPPPPGLGKPAGVISIPKGNFSRGSGVGSGLQGLFDLAALDQKPVPRFLAKPAYPFEMRRSGVNGEVLVGFIVDADGNVRDPFVVRSTNPAFESEALRAAARCKFRPGRKGGVNVSTRNVILPYSFTLTDNA